MFLVKPNGVKGTQMPNHFNEFGVAQLSKSTATNHWPGFHDGPQVVNMDIHEKPFRTVCFGVKIQQKMKS
ncbi:MAG: hypothetical protein ACKO26_15555 [Planctomycetota bacterium]